MHLRRKFHPGQMVVVMTLALTALLGALALGTDVAVIYLNWMELRKAADSAALAGAEYLGPFAATLPMSASCSWGGGGNPAYDVACSYAESNGVAPSEILSIGPAAMLPSNETVPPGAQTLQVSLRRSTIPMFFAKLVMPSSSNFAAAVDATAIGPAPIQTMTQGMFPAGLSVTPSPSVDYPQPVSLTSGSSGNLAWLDLSACSPVGSQPAAHPRDHGANLAQDIANGSTCSYSIGNTIRVVSNTNFNNHSADIDNAMQARIANPNLPPPSLMQLNTADPQVAVVPLVQMGTTTGPSGKTHQNATIVGFATLWLMNYSDTGSSQTIGGDFMQYTDRYGVGGALADYGAYSRPFLID
jgi:Putative Flp pilus-assembly TadE/G-like